MKRLACAFLLCTASSAWAQSAGEPSRDDAIFGGADEAPDKPEAGEKADAATSKDGAKDEGKDAAGDYGDERMSGGAAKENSELLYKDKSQLGGFLYLRGSASYGQGAKASDIALGNANLFDAYFDSRLNDRLRAFVRGRVLYNPLASAATGGVNAQSALGAPVSTDTTKALLTQMWLKFDISRTVFLTVGQQFVRWGTTRFWNPVDVLNTTKVNPLAFFDERTGVPMLKLHVPIEKYGWNVYGIVLSDSATSIDRLGAAVRAEALFGHTEIGLASIFRKSVDPKVGLDVSSGLGDFDLTGEFGVVFPSTGSPQWQLAAGASWTWAYREDDSLTLGVEYFHNDQGLTAAQVLDGYVNAYSTAVTNGTPVVTPSYTPLYTGRDYVGVLASVASPGSLNDASITALALTNLTDASGTAQVNFSTLILTDLTVEAYTGVSWGDGELRGYLPYIVKNVPARMDALGIPKDAQAQILAPISAINPPLLRAGLNLRVNL